MTTATMESVFPAYAHVTALRAGPISLLFSNGDLRQLRVGGVEIVQRIYVAVRDKDWGTAPVSLHDLVVDDRHDHFHITFTAVNRQGEIGFTWLGEITGDADGTIRFTMDGRADTTFLRNRLGFCVLHPASAAGSPALLTHSNGSKSPSQFPTLVSPHQPFMDLRALAHEFAPGLQAEVSFEGDIFESEDQRNWTDASYKTYSTPLAIPYPVKVEAGTTIHQAVGVRLIGQSVGISAAATTTPVTVTVGSAQGGRLPLLGLCSASHGQPLTVNETKLLSALSLSHLRVDLDLSSADLDVKLARAAQDAASVNAGLEIALFAGLDIGGELSNLERAFSAVKPVVARWLLFSRREDVTPAQIAQAARPVLTKLAPHAPIGGGSNLYFVHINRDHPPVNDLDFVSYSINPQVHAFDLISLVENMTAQPSTVNSTRAFCNDLPIVISPITLKARFNADAAGPEAPPPPGELPFAVDPRLPTGFAAAWTLGSLSNLAQAGVASLTYYETTGWRGLIESEQGSPLPDLFPSKAGAPFPVYHLFAAIAPYTGGDLAPVTVNEPLQVAALTLSKGGKQCTIIGNLHDTPQRIAIEGLMGPVSLQTLGDPSGSIQLDAAQAPLMVDLAPYMLVSLQSKT